MPSDVATIGLFTTPPLSKKPYSGPTCIPQMVLCQCTLTYKPTFTKYWNTFTVFLMIGNDGPELTMSEKTNINKQSNSIQFKAFFFY